MKKFYLKALLIIGIGFLLYSCNEEDKTPEQIERDKIMAIEDLLRNNQWAFTDMSVSVKFESRAIPLLANVADENGMVQPGIYDSYAIFGNNNRQLNYTYKFTRDDIMLDTSNVEDFNKIAGYYVLSTSQIRINPDSSNSINFNYVNQSEENRFLLSTTSIYSEELIASINNIIINRVLLGKPNDISEAFVNLLLENEKVSKAIEQFLYNMIHGKIEEITQSPEQLSEELAKIIVQKLGEIDWEELLFDKILTFLQDLQEINPEEKATKIAQRLADKIDASLTQSDIYDVLLPVLENFENETIPVLSSQIAAAIYEKIAEALSEENLYNRIYPIWDDLTKADTTSVIETADTLAAIVTARFFDSDTLTESLIPFVQKIEDTPSLKLSKLSQEIIDSVLIPAVDNINEAFPGAELDPDWSTIKPVISGLLTAIKAGLGSSTVEELAGTLAEGIIGIMDLVLQKGFEKAIYSLQQIPAEQVATVVSSWITNLVEMAEQPVVDFIEDKLNAILDKFEAEKAAEELSVIIHAKLLEVFSEENLYKLFLPILEAFQKIDIEKVAKIIAEWIIDLGLISDNITEDQLIAKLSEILSGLIGNINPDEAAEKLVELILENDLVKNLDGKLLKFVLESKLYELMNTLAGDVNAIDNFEIVIQRK